LVFVGEITSLVLYKKSKIEIEKGRATADPAFKIFPDRFV
jgi:hypothetical protein